MFEEVVGGAVEEMVKEVVGAIEEVKEVDEVDEVVKVVVVLVLEVGEVTAMKRRSLHWCV